MSTVLARIENPSPLPVLDEAERIAYEAAKALNYSPFKKYLDKTRAYNKSVAILSELGVAPFQTSSVIRYKATMLWKARSRTAQIVGTLIIIIATAGLIGLTHCPIWLIGTFLSSIILAVTTNAGSNGRYKWRCHSLEAFEDPVPMHVLDKAMEIKASFKEHGERVRFEVDALHKEKVLDPFLIVVDEEGNEFYVMVWDEPDFNV